MSSTRKKNQTKAPTKHDSPELFHIDNVLSNVEFSQFTAMLCMFEDNEAVIKMMIKRQESHNETCVKNPQSFSWLAVWQSQFGSQDSNRVRWHHTRLLTYWQKDTAHVTNGIIFFVCSTSAISAPLCCAKNFSLLSCTERMANRMQERSEENRIVAKSKPTAMTPGQF